MATTTNYGWDTPDDTDLVKDGAAAIRTLGSSVDTTTKNLNPQTTTGALAYRSATANVNTALTIGTTGQILTVAGGVPTWATPTSGGKILQVIEGSTTTQTTISSGSFTDTGITATITPASASSKILIIVSASVLSYATTGTSLIADTQLLRGATQIADLNTFVRLSQPSNFSDNSIGINGAITKLDSPNTTSATTYKVQAKQGGGTIYFQHASNRSTIILMEVGA